MSIHELTQIHSNIFHDLFVDEVLPDNSFVLKTSSTEINK